MTNLNKYPTIVFSVFISLLIFTGCNLSSDLSGASSLASDANSSPEGANGEVVLPIVPNPAPVVENEPEPISLEGLQICYEQGIESCHSIVSATNMETPGEYIYPNSNNFQYRKPTHYIDLDKPSTSEYVSPNFKRSEFVARFKGRYGILSPLLVEKAQKMRDAIKQPIKITSGFRGPTYNASIGGASLSRHMYGDAIDFQSGGRAPSELKVFCEEQGASFIQVYVNHVHCDWRNRSLPEEFYSISNSILANSLELHVGEESYKAFSKSIEIHYANPARIGNSIRLFVTSENAEDAGDKLLREWQVYKDGKLILAESNLELELGLVRGFYSIEVVVGGYWKKSRTLVVED